VTKSFFHKKALHPTSNLGVSKILIIGNYFALINKSKDLYIRKR